MLAVVLCPGPVARERGVFSTPAREKGGFQRQNRTSPVYIRLEGETAGFQKPLLGGGFLPGDRTEPHVWVSWDKESGAGRRRAGVLLFTDGVEKTT